VVFANSPLKWFQPISLVVPSGWKQVALFTDLDLVTRKVFQVSIVRNIQDRHELTFESKVDPAIQRFSSNQSSAFGESENFMSTMSSISEGPWMSDPNSLGLGAPPEDTASTGNIRYTFLETVPNVSATNHSPPLAHQDRTYVTCSPQVFAHGIKYDNEFLSTYFPMAYVTISDAKIMARNHLNTRPHDVGPFRTYCAQVVSEMMTVAASAGQAAESGRHC
jgi:hypothetical protein